MTIFHCFLCDNIDRRMLALHEEASKLAGVAVEYHVFGVAELRAMGLSPHEGHGWFMEEVLSDAEDETIGFIDVDCIISSAEHVDKWTEQVKNSGTILGVAQSANHLPSFLEIYAAPAMLVVSNGAWNLAGRPSLIADCNYDTGQRLSHNLDANSYQVDLLMPASHSGEGASWPLADKGTYGIGTIYGNGEVFHLFQSSRGPSYLHLLEQEIKQLSLGNKLFS